MHTQRCDLCIYWAASQLPYNPFSLQRLVSLPSVWDSNAGASTLCRVLLSQCFLLYYACYARNCHASMKVFEAAISSCPLLKRFLQALRRSSLACLLAATETFASSRSLCVGPLWTSGGFLNADIVIKDRNATCLTTVLHINSSYNSSFVLKNVRSSFRLSYSVGYFLLSSSCWGQVQGSLQPHGLCLYRWHMTGESSYRCICVNWNWTLCSLDNYKNLCADSWGCSPSRLGRVRTQAAMWWHLLRNEWDRMQVSCGLPRGGQW